MSRLVSRSWIALAVALAFGLAAVLVRLAWVGDDAYITLRTVENFVQGRGLVWNVAERVQTYTHPLWLLLLSGVRLVTGESFFGTIAVSWLLTLASAVLLMRHAGTWAAAAAVGGLLLGSRSFTEYGICGLENPLTFVLLAGFAAAALASSDPTARTRRTALLAALAATTRLDLGLLCAPMLLANWRGQPFGGWLRRTALGMAPLMAWLLFAAVYYGSPFPITALAKATNLGVPAIDLMQQGWLFYQYAALHDPLTLIVVVAGTVVGLIRGPREGRALALGVLLYGAYIVVVGGDFMGGRFFTPPFVVAVAILARAFGQSRPRLSAATLVATAVTISLPGLPDWTHAPALDTPPSSHFHGIVDERRCYYEAQGLLSPKRSVPSSGIASRALLAAGHEKPLIMTYGVAGRYAFEAGELLHVVDPCLLDPLLMRLPVEDPHVWRIGHFVRAMPEGYLESIATGQPLIRHPGLARYYATLAAVIDVRVPVFAAARLQALWDLWTGRHADGLAAYVGEAYRNPPVLDADGAALARRLPNSGLGTGPQWFDEPQTRLVLRGGLRIHFASTTSASRLELQLQGGRDLFYRVRVYRDGKLLGEHRIDASAFPAAAGMQPFACDLPADQPGFDMVSVDVPEYPAHVVACVGSLRLVP